MSIRTNWKQQFRLDGSFQDSPPVFYYELLNNVRLTGDREAWLHFYAEAVMVTAFHAVETARQLLELSNNDRDKIRELSPLVSGCSANPISWSGNWNICFQGMLQNHKLKS